MGVVRLIPLQHEGTAAGTVWAQNAPVAGRKVRQCYVLPVKCAHSGTAQEKSMPKDEHMDQGSPWRARTRMKYAKDQGRPWRDEAYSPRAEKNCWVVASFRRTVLSAESRYREGRARTLYSRSVRITKPGS